MKKILLVALVVLCLAVAPAFAVTNVTECPYIFSTENEVYQLTVDIIDQDCSDPFIVDADNVIFDCLGHTIDGFSAYQAVFNGNWGDEYFGGDNFTVRNCVITDFPKCVYTEMDDNIIYNNSFSCGTQNIFIKGRDTSVIGNTISNGGIGVYCEGCDGLNISGNIIFDFDEQSISLFDGDNIIIVDNNISNTYEIEFNGVSIDNYTIYGNRFNVTQNILFDLIPSSLVFNSSVEGNYWGLADLSGYSDTCDNYDADVFCDESYDVFGDASYYDYLPLTNHVTYNHTLTSCGNVSEGGLWTVASDLMALVNNSVCIGINAGDVVLDCQNHLLNTTAENVTGVYLDGHDNATIENCVFAPFWVEDLVVHRFDYDVWLEDGDNIFLANNSFNSTAHGGIQTYVSGVGTYNFDGNYWGTYYHNGFSDSCSASGGYCTSSYDIFGDDSYYDMTPLSNNPEQLAQGAFGVLLTSIGQGIAGFLGGVQDPLVNFLLLIAIVTGFATVFFLAVAMAVRNALKK